MSKTVDLNGKKVLVLGLGLSGVAASLFLLERGAFVTGVDRDAKKLQSDPEICILRKNGATILQDSASVDVSSFDLCVVSPGIPKTDFLYAKAKEAGLDVVGEIELAARYNKKTLIGITGTNGKTTVSLMVGHALNFCGKKAAVVGNIGVPLIKEVGSAAKKVLVCELSSYQLETMKTPSLDIGLILNITPDHLDRYPNMQAYAAAKMGMQRVMKKSGTLFVERTAFEKYGEMLENFPCKTYGYTRECDVYTDLQRIYFKENIETILPLQYRDRSYHDLENLMAAFAVCREFGLGWRDFEKALTTFKKPRHRIEFVCKKDGVSFYDDSKGTNIDAVIRAVEAMEGNVVLIAGGLDKGASYTSWIKAFEGKVKMICLIGSAKHKMEKELSCSFPTKICHTMDEAVQFSGNLAKCGENVLLSPGCASFDMFRDYSHRGEEFKRCVINLKGEEVL